MLSPEGLVAAAAVLVGLGLLAWCLWAGRLEVPGDVGEEEEEEGIPFMAEEGSGHCRLLCKPSALAQHLVRSLGRSAALRGGHWPWPRWPQLQMLWQLLQPPEPEPVVARELLQLPDAGVVALDWLVGPWGAAGGGGGVSSPVLLLIPNAAGKVTGGLLQLGLRALERGFIPVIFNRRGHNGCPLTTPRLQPFGDPGDLREAVTYLRCRHPSASLLAVSEGSGSGLLLAYLGESGSSSRLAAAACLSPIFRGRDWFEAGMPWLYEWPLLLHLKQGLSRSVESLGHGEVEGVPREPLSHPWGCACRGRCCRHREPQCRGRGAEGSKTCWLMNTSLELAAMGPAGPPHVSPVRLGLRQHLGVPELGGVGEAPVWCWTPRGEWGWPLAPHCPLSPAPDPPAGPGDANPRLGRGL